MKKSILISIQDQHEIKLLLRSNLFNFIAQSNSITFLSALSTNDNFISMIRSKWPNGDFEFIDAKNCYSHITFFNKIMYAFILFLFHIYHHENSESSKQKLLIYARIKMSDVLKNNQYQFISSLISSIAWIIPKKLALKSIRPYSKKTKKFDYIFFMKSYTLLNLGITKEYGHKETKIITLCRNLDTPFLKGTYVINSDITLAYSSFMAESIRRLLPKSNRGKIIEIENPLQSLDNDYKKNNAGNFQITFFGNLPLATPDDEQFDTVKFMLEIMIKKHLDIKFFIKPHAANRKNLFSSLEKTWPDHVVIVSSNKTHQSTHQNQILESHTTKSIDNHYQLIKNSSIVLSFGSTVNYEAYFLKVPSCFINFQRDIDNAYGPTYKREHIKYMIDHSEAKLISDRANFIQHIESEYIKKSERSLCENTDYLHNQK